MKNKRKRKAIVVSLTEEELNWHREKNPAYIRSLKINDITIQIKLKL